MSRHEYFYRLERKRREGDATLEEHLIMFYNELLANISETCCQYIKNGSIDSDKYVETIRNILGTKSLDGTLIEGIRSYESAIDFMYEQIEYGQAEEEELE